MTPSNTRWRPAAVLILLALVLSLLAPAVAMAHAELVSTDPAEGATVEGSPTEISATFSEALLAEGSGLSLRDAAGERIAVGDVDPDDEERLVITDVPDLAPGEYEARWTARSDDGHLERGTWTFTVIAPASPTPAPSPTPSPSAAASPTATSSASATPASPSAPPPSPSPAASASPTPAPSPDPNATGSGSGDVLLPILAGLAIVAIAGGVLLSRRGRTPTA
jgi:methionine-rich copper-binding protein CopC